MNGLQLRISLVLSLDRTVLHEELCSKHELRIGHIIHVIVIDRVAFVHNIEIIVEDSRVVRARH